MKLYNVSRILLFTILIDFGLCLQHAGELFVTAVISDADATAILAKWPNSISQIY